MVTPLVFLRIFLMIIFFLSSSNYRYYLTIAWYDPPYAFNTITYLIPTYETKNFDVFDGIHHFFFSVSKSILRIYRCRIRLNGCRIFSVKNVSSTAPIETFN